MRITKVETIRSPCRNYCWILLHTDNGWVGVGETYHRADPAEVIVHEFGRHCLLGSNPEDIEKIWHQMYMRASYHGLMGAELRAISGIDMALWDLLGKALERPLYRILGGQTRDRVPVRPPQLRSPELHGTDPSDGGDPQYPSPGVHRVSLSHVEHLHRRTDRGHRRAPAPAATAGVGTRTQRRDAATPPNDH